MRKAEIDLDWLDAEIVSAEGETGYQQALIEVRSKCKPIEKPLVVLGEFEAYRTTESRMIIEGMRRDGLPPPPEISAILEQLPPTFGGLAKYRLAQMLNYSTKACGGILKTN